MLETVVFGKIAGERATQWIRAEDFTPDRNLLQVRHTEREQRINVLLGATGKEKVGQLRHELRKTMMEHVGVYRNPQEMRVAVNDIQHIRERFKSVAFSSSGRRFNLELQTALEMEAMIDLAWVIAAGALRRQESRGSHARPDFPARDDEHWLKHTIATYTPDGPQFSDKEVDLSRWEPVERKY